MCDKAGARSRFRALRKQLKDEKKDETIARLALAAFGDFPSFFVYLSISSETGTEKLIAELKKRGKTVCAPRLFGKEMRSVPLEGILEKGAFDIPEPAGEEELTCAVAFTPLLAADEEGYRLGYGGGYYDRYFSAHPKILRVGLCYEGQRTDKLPREDTDMRLDALVTERGVFCFPQGRLQGHFGEEQR